MGLLASGSIWAIGVDTNQIYQAATWKSSNMFAWHYCLDVLQKQLIRFSMRILQATATSSAEFALSGTLMHTSPIKKLLQR